MSQTDSIAIKLLDRSFAINCPDEAQPELEAAAAYLENKMVEIRNQSKLSSFEQVAVMTALNLAHELLNNGQPQDTAATDEINIKIDQLSSRLEQSLNSKND